jgi:TctA family transporter
MTQRPDLFWGMVASMLIGNLMLLVINLPMVGLWVKLLSVPYRNLFPGVIVCCCIGAYSLTNNVMDIWLTILFGTIGYGLRRLGYEPAPLVLGLILGPMFEENFRRSMLLSDGNLAVFFTRPISGVITAISIVLIAMVLGPRMRRRRAVIFSE